MAPVHVEKHIHVPPSRQNKLSLGLSQWKENNYVNVSLSYKGTNSFHIKLKLLELLRNLRNGIILIIRKDCDTSDLEAV